MTNTFIKDSKNVNDMTPSTATHQSELLKTIYTKRSLSEIQTQLPPTRFDTVFNTPGNKVKKPERDSRVKIESNDYSSNGQNQAQSLKHIRKVPKVTRSTRMQNSEDRNN